MTTRQRGVLAIVLLCGMSASAAQQARDFAASSMRGTATVSGVVITGPGGTPARRARVTLRDVSRQVPGQTATTDDSGRFVFTAVPAGRFEVQAFKNGFLRASYGAARPDRPGTPLVVRDGEAIGNLALSIARGGVITGTVRDSQGRPVPDAAVRVLRLGYSVETGEPTLGVPSGSTIAPTDDRGEYRAFGLPPGGYIVLFTPAPSRGGGPGDSIRPLTPAEVQRALQAVRAGGALPTVAPTPAAPVNYAPVFYEVTHDISRAMTVAVGVSEERKGVDITVELAPAATISGRVTAATGTWPTPLSIVVSPAGPSAGMLGGAGLRGLSTTAGPDGFYTLGGVPPGNYTLKAMAGLSAGRGRSTADGPTMSASMDITVSGRDLQVPLTLTPGVAITGRVVFTGEPPSPTEMQSLSMQLLPQGGGGVRLSTNGGRVGADGRFTFAGVPPDTYYLLPNWTSPAAGLRWTVTRAVANGQDAFEAPLRLGPSTAIDLAVTFTDKPSVVSGVFRHRAGRAASDYYVLVFSADRKYWAPGSRRIRMTRPATDGAFEIRGLPPGEYLLGALAELEPGEWHDPTLLEQLSPLAVKVTLREGQTTTQDVTTGN